MKRAPWRPLGIVFFEKCELHLRFIGLSFWLGRFRASALFGGDASPAQFFDGDKFPGCLAVSRVAVGGTILKPAVVDLHRFTVSIIECVVRIITIAVGLTSAAKGRVGQSLKSIHVRYSNL